MGSIGPFIRVLEGPVETDPSETLISAIGFYGRFCDFRYLGRAARIRGSNLPISFDRVSELEVLRWQNQRRN